MNKNWNKSVVNLACAGLLLLGGPAAGYTFDRQYPIDTYKGVTANYGQFRRTTGVYQVYDGIDLRAKERSR
jgi:hypothetical protein